MKFDVLIVGGGVNGLTAAAYLARTGKRVGVLEQQKSLGGVCVTQEFHPGFRANVCVDDPGWMPAHVAQDLSLAAHGYTPAFAPVGAVFPGQSGEAVMLPSQPAQAVAALRTHAPADAARWEAFCGQVHRLSGMLQALYNERTPVIGRPAMADLMPLLALGRRLRGLGKRGMVDFLRAVPMPVADYLDEWFESPQLKGALAMWGVRDVQHGPMSGGTTLVYLHQHVGMPAGLMGGRRLVPGGVGQLPLALAAAAKAAGAEIRLNAEVIQIVTKNAAISGVVLVNGEQLEAPVVLCSADVRRTFGMLMEPGLFDPDFLGATHNVRMRSPVVRLHLALDGLPATSWSREALGGTITLAGDMVQIEQAYDAAKHGGIASRPCLQVTIPSLHDSGMAPAGKHVMTVHAQFSAYRQQGGWTTDQQRLAVEATLQQLNSWMPGLSDHVLQVASYTPADVEREFLVTEGSTIHGELALDQFLFMRPVPECARYATPIPGLWLCGSSVHPGAGTACASGWLAAREVMNTWKKK